MLNFFKKLGGGDQPDQPSGQTHGHGGPGDSKDYYWENKKLTEFLLANYPKLSQKRFLYYQNRDPNEEETIDVTNFFEEKDKYLATENEQNNIFFSEFRYLSKEDLKPEEVMTRIEVLEKYHKRINETVQKSATKNYDKFRKTDNCSIMYRARNKQS